MWISLWGSSAQNSGLNNEIKFLGKGLHLITSLSDSCSGHVLVRGNTYGVSGNMHTHARLCSSV